MYGADLAPKTYTRRMHAPSAQACGMNRVGLAEQAVTDATDRAQSDARCDV